MDDQTVNLVLWLVVLLVVLGGYYLYHRYIAKKPHDEAVEAAVEDTLAHGEERSVIEDEIRDRLNLDDEENGDG